MITQQRQGVMLLWMSGVWLITGLFFFSQMYLLYPHLGRPFNIMGELVWEFTLSFLWIIFTPLILVLSNRFRIERHRWLKPLAIHLVASVILGLVQCTMHGLILKVIFDSASPLVFSKLLPSFYYNIDKMFMVYWVIVLLNHSYVYNQKFRERELQAVELEAQLAQTQLQTLKMQLHPHFLFNTLNTISSLMHSDVEAADRMLARLSDLLRLTLESAGKQLVPLKEELDFLRRYIEIEQIRFHDRLTVHLKIAPETLDVLVPTLILQPLVENAIRHGIAPRAAPGCVEVSTSRENGALLIRIKDNGVGLGLTGTSVLNEGLGISNTRSRLQKIYASLSRFEITNAVSGGVIVDISIPS